MFIPAALCQYFTRDGCCRGTTFVDTELMHEQIGAFARALLLIDRMATDTLGRADQSS